MGLNAVALRRFPAAIAAPITGGNTRTKNSDGPKAIAVRIRSCLSTA
jgi:hypothetical protein